MAQRTRVKRPTIRDVARLAGVSHTTVSFVINAVPHISISEATRRRVALAIAQLDYRPNALARSLVTKRSLAIGLLISDVANSFYHPVIQGVEHIAIMAGYDTFLCNTDYDIDRGLHFVRSLMSKNVDGVLIMSSSVSDAWIAELVAQQVPVVALDWEPTMTDEALGVIAVDFETGIRQAVDHLIELGHRRFAHVGGPLGLRTSRLRRDAFLAALGAHQIPAADVVVLEGNLQINGGQRALDELLALSPRPTAVFAANDLTALGLMWEARDRGLSIPDDLSIIGIDDIALASQTSPPLTTIGLPKREIGTLAMEMLLALMRDSAVAPAMHTATVVSALVKRHSTAAPSRYADRP